MAQPAFPRFRGVVWNSVTVALLLVVCAGGGFAQRRGAVPAAVYHRNSRERSAVPPGLRKRMSRPAAHRLGPLADTELQRLRPGLEAVGVHRRLSSAGIRHDEGPDANRMIVAGAWSEQNGGSRVWRLAIDSENAAGLRIHFTDFAVGAGRVWVYGTGADEPRSESFTGNGPRGDGDFWSQTVFGSEAVIEFEPDATSPDAETVPFQIREVAHLWSTPQRMLAPPRARSGATQLRSVRDFVEQLPAVGSTTVSGEDTPSSPNASVIAAQAASCQVDVACYAEWDQTSRAVALILFESDGSSYACSGTLLNTRDQSFIPYFLTAAHCITSDADAHTVEAFWQFRSTTCNGETPAISELASTLGARQILRLGDFDDTRGDFNLLLLNDVPDGVVFAGWDPNRIALGTPVVGIHHPAGEQQRITFGTTVPDRYYGVSNAYVVVQEDLGRTEQGSSGSGLFSTANVLTGVLSFGPLLRRGQTACDRQPNYVGYSSFSALYPSISDYLEDAAPPPDLNTPLVSGVPRSFSIAAVRRPTLLDEPLLRVEVPEDATALTIDLGSVTPASVDVDLYVRYGEAPVVANGEVVTDFESISPTATEQIVIDSTTTPPLQAGTYYIRLALLTRSTAVTGQVRSTLTTGSLDLSKSPPKINAILHAADQRESVIAPGQLVSIYGVGLGDPEGVQPGLDAAGRIPTGVNGVSVEFGGVAAPILFVRADQINAQVPYEIGGLDTVTVTVTRNGVTAQPFSVTVGEASPDIFTYLDGSNRAVAFNQDGSLNSPDNPAARGQIIVFYVTGEGQTIPAQLTGALASAQAPTPVPALPVSVEIGGAPAEILYAGIPPGLAGVMQINARISPDAIHGDGVFLVTRVGSAESRMVYVSVN